MYHARIALRRGKPFRRKHSLTELNIIWERKVLEVLMYNVGIGKEECSEEKRERKIECTTTHGYSRKVREATFIVVSHVHPAVKHDVLPSHRYKHAASADIWEGKGEEERRKYGGKKRLAQLYVSVRLQLPKRRFIH